MLTHFRESVKAFQLTHELNGVVSSYSVFPLKLTGGEDDLAAVLTSVWQVESVKVEGCCAGHEGPSLPRPLVEEGGL